MKAKGKKRGKTTILSRIIKIGLTKNIQPEPLNIIENEVEFEPILDSPESVIFEGKKVVSILGQDKRNSAYKCKMEDGTLESVPMELFNFNNNKN